MEASTGESPLPDHPTDTVRKIGQYLVFEELGRGAGGIVYRALDPRIGRDLAIKELRLSQLAPHEIPEARQRFFREARAVGNLRHDNVVMLYQFLEEHESLYLVMEFVAGGSLHSLIRGEVPLTTEISLGIIRQVAAALDHAHAVGIVHRDIKPGNILVSKERINNHPLIKVADFGIARISSESMTVTGTALGTPAYMAPEQINGSKVDAKADQFSLAVVAYELLARKRPFTGPNDQALIFQILSAEPASLRETNPAFSPEVDGVIRRAMDKNPDKRFDSCGAFCAALEQSILPVFAVMEDATRKSLPAELPAPRRAFPLTALLLVTALLAGLGLYFGFRSDHDNPPVAPRAPVAGKTTTAPPETATPPPPAMAIPDSPVPARLISQVKPEYPSRARQQGIQGVVKFEAVIGRNGAIKKLNRLSGNPYLVAAAELAVHRWRYEPALLHGQPVESTINIDVNFTLNQDR